MRHKLDLFPELVEMDGVLAVHSMNGFRTAADITQIVRQITNGRWS